MTGQSRPAVIAAAWATALNAVDFGVGGPLIAERVYSVSDALPDRSQRAVQVMGRADRCEPITRETWLHRIETATAVRVRSTAVPAVVDAYAELAQRIGDYGKKMRPLCLLGGYPVMLESVAVTLWLPSDLEKLGLFTHVVVHTWRVEQDVPTFALLTESSSSPDPD